MTDEFSQEAWDEFLRDLREAKADLEGLTKGLTEMTIARDKWRDHLMHLVVMAEVGTVAFHSQLKVATEALSADDPRWAEKLHEGAARIMDAARPDLTPPPGGGDG